MPDGGSKEDSPGELERLGDELSRREMRTTLAPALKGEDGGIVLEVVNPRVTIIGPAVSGVRVWHRAGRFWWHGGEDLGSGSDILRAADRVAAALQWSRQYPGLAPPA